MADRTFDHRTLDRGALDHRTLEPADRALVARDAAMPVLAEVLDATALAARLTTATGSSGVLSGPYLRYKRGTSCLLAVRWTPDGANDGANDGASDRPSDGASVGARPLLVRAYAEHARPKLDKAVRHARPGELVHVDRAAGIVVTAWTADRDLPGIRLVPQRNDGDRAVGAPLDDPALGAPRLGDPQLDDQPLGDPAAGPRLLRHNPERRAVLRLDGADARDVLDALDPLADPGGSERSVLVRLSRPGAVERTLAGYGLLGASGVRAPRILAHDTQRGVVVTQWVPGDPLDTLDLAGSLDERDLRAVGATAAALHTSAPHTSASHSSLHPSASHSSLHPSASHSSLHPSAGTEAGRATHRGRHSAPVAAAITGLLPWLAGAVEPLADALDRSRPALPGRAVPVHGDLSLDQLVRTPSDELWLVDGDAARWGAPEDDLGSLAAALVRAHDDVATAADRLAVVLAGYAAAGAPAIDVAALRRATAEHLLRRAPEPFRRREAGWAATTERLVALADEVTRGRGRQLGDVLDHRATGARRAASGGDVPLGAPSSSPSPTAPATPAASAASATPAGSAESTGQAGRTDRSVPASPRVPAQVRPAEGIRFAPVARALADRLADDGGRLRAAVPRAGGRLLVVGSDRCGALVAGRWDEDPSAAARYARRAGVDVADVATGGLVLLPGGQDPDLPELGGRLHAGSELVAHRAGRRAVVRDAAGTYTKVMRPGREPADAVVPPDAFATPAVVDRGPGRVTTAPLPGRTLHDLLGDPTLPERVLDDAGRAIGRGLRRLQGLGGHTGAAGSGRDGDGGPVAVPRHDVDAEVAVVRRWWHLAAAHGATDGATAAAVVDHVARTLADVAPLPAVRAHRDLHDKQLLVDADAPGRVGLLDLDLATTAHPALDLANLLVHLELRALQGLCSPDRGARVARAVVAGYAADADGGASAARLPAAADVIAWATAARARLAAVYAFRPAPGDVPGALLAGLARPLTLPFPQLDTLFDTLLDTLLDTQEDR